MNNKNNTILAIALLITISGTIGIFLGLKKNNNIENIQTQPTQKTTENGDKKNSVSDQNQKDNEWEVYSNKKANFLIEYPNEWGPITTETFREAISGLGEEFYTLFSNSRLSISGNTTDYKPWESFAPEYIGTDPLLHCKEVERRVISLDGCKMIDNNKAIITFGYYSDLSGLLLLRQAYVKNYGNKYAGVTISYFFKGEDTGLTNMDDDQIRITIKNQLKNIDKNIVTIFDNIVSSFNNIENKK